MSKLQKNLVRSLMREVRKLLPGDSSGEQQKAVRMFAKVLQFRDLLSGNVFSRWLGDHSWPVTSGSYIVGNRTGSIAICTLTSSELMKPLSAIDDSVALTGQLVTVNLGIEKVILNVISNPHIRFLMLCGKDSPVFHTAQGLQSLFRNGVDSKKHIIGAKGHYPVLTNINRNQIKRFCDQVELIDITNELNIPKLGNRIEELSVLKKSPLGTDAQPTTHGPHTSPQNTFKNIRPGGQRAETYDPEGFFVIEVDHKEGKIVLRHYLPDNTPAHKMYGRRADAMIRGLMREGLISQLSHAGYLGVELAKAETALRLGLDYEQDHPIKK